MMFYSDRNKILARVVQDNLDYLVRFAFFRIGDKDEAEDIVSDAVLKFLTKPPLSLKADKLKSYLFKIVYNLCMDYLRDDTQMVSMEAIAAIQEPVEETESCEQEFARLTSILSGLPEKEAEIIRMNVIDELTFAEIGVILDIPASTAKSRYKSGMDKLRRRYMTKKSRGYE